MVRLAPPFQAVRADWLTTLSSHRQLQYTEDESKAVRVVTNELHVYSPADWSKNIVDKLRSEGITSCSVSPGKNPAVALFAAEKKVRTCRLSRATDSRS